MRYSKLILGIALLLVVLSFSTRSAFAGVYGPNWASEPFLASISHSSFYMIDTDPPAPQNGYNWIDCDSFNGGASTQINSAQPNVSNQIWTSPIKLQFGFDFPYFGNNFDGIYVSLHGWISFENPGNPRSSITARPDNLPISQAPFDNFIAVYWDHLYQTLSQGQVFFKQTVSATTGLNGLVVQWHDIILSQAQPANSLFFQAVFWENGDINFNYTSLNPPTLYGNGSSATVGLRAGDQYIEYCYNQASLTSAGAGIYFTYSEPDLPPIVSIGNNNPNKLEEFPNTANEKVILQFALEPKNVEGTIDGVGIIVQGPKPGEGALQPQSFSLYIVRDMNGNGFRDPEDPVVSGTDASGNPYWWDPWALGSYSVPIGMYDSPLTSEIDNAMLFAEGDNGKKTYLVFALWNNLQSLDEYNIGVSTLHLSGTHYSALSPSIANLLGTTLTVQDLTGLEVLGPYVYPPDPEQDIDVLAENVVALSFSVTASPDFPADMVALGLRKSGSGQGMYVATRIYKDNGERGVFEPGTDVDVTADGWLSTTTSATGSSLAEGNPSGVFYIFLTSPPDPDNPEEHHTYLAQNGGTKHYLVVCTFYQILANEGDTYRVSLSEIYYTGGPGSPLILDNELDGSVMRLVAPDLPLEVQTTPFTPETASLSAVPSGKNLTVGRFSFRPYNRDGVLHQFTLNASGTGDDYADVDRVRVIYDSNMNGIHDPSDYVYHDGKWDTDNGSLTIVLQSEHTAFNAWQGGTSEDYANMKHFILTYDFSDVVDYGATFSYSVSEIQFTYSNLDRTVLPTNWESPVVTIEDIIQTEISVEPSTFSSVRERFLTPAGANTTNLEMAVVKVTAGASAIRVSSFTLATDFGGFTGDGDESIAIDEIWMYPDINLNNVSEPGNGETVSWFGDATSRPFVANNGSATIFVLEPTFGEMSPYYLPANQTVHWRIYFKFNSNTLPGKAFMATVTSMQYELSSGSNFVSQPPLQVNIEGGRKESVASVNNGGSMTITKGPAMASGARRYVLPGGFSEILQFRLFCGNVEAIRLDSFDFHFLGTADIWAAPTTLGNDLAGVSIVRDNGDGAADSTYDTWINGNATANQATNTITIIPDAVNPFIMQPGSTEYFIISYIIGNTNPQVATGTTFSAYIGPTDLHLTGGNTTGGWTPRYIGDPVQRFGNNIYGWTAILGSVYDTGGYTGTDVVGSGDATPDNGNPWSSANTDPTAGGGSGCFIATASFGSLSTQIVQDLCSARDNAIKASACGDSLVSLYYTVSPVVADDLATSNAARALVRSLLK